MIPHGDGGGSGVGGLGWEFWAVSFTIKDADFFETYCD
jgi:hypothetical protein